MTTYAVTHFVRVVFSDDGLQATAELVASCRHRTYVIRSVRMKLSDKYVTSDEMDEAISKLMISL